MTFPRTRCKHCKGKLETGQRILHPACIDDFAVAEAARMERKKAKEARAAAKVERAETRRRKEAIKTLPKLKKEAEREFNAFIRARDAHLPCISCGAPPPDLSGLHAGRDAGHYRSVGSAAHLRYHEDNVHAQCVHCNQYGAGRAVEYRIGLIARIGEGRVVALETNNTVRKFAHDELRGIRDTYKAKLKEMKC
ncbi:recombination protein NinG [Acidovorax radicis]|uniref:recombination protein NinG n=1 Tax=Acidovorax radicis TaxID=758826 RepID=UPI001CFBD7D0|nr:recombination protein NinG [Acidovorax radicis]UCV00280.1 recombination protein NinG [Acidovorax radicis]